MAPDQCIAHQPFSVHHRSNGLSSLLGSLTCCVRKLSSTHSRDVPNSPLYCIFSRHLVSWNLPWEQGLMTVKLFPVAYGIFHLPLHCGWMVCSKLSSAYHLPYWAFPLSSPINTHPYHHHYLAPDNQNSPSYSSLLIPSKEVIDIHCNTPVVWLLPSCLCGSHAIIFLLHHGFQFFPFVVHAVCIGVDALQLGLLIPPPIREEKP